ncbi:hypothetical protein EDI_351340 [Entamoeba dispar SAW760]|uniref:Uncharacterized protein n=1 Tax=Entamoeba dispar (strain ATCC PRA-260 / SAW760) TaxID=370354 RepID=B0ER96_ENTDS|nr:uncharacterized protein EDI_351340 [Entamoeba dispar SAW760]EDR22944.1 hypothetical protein EDI_351340 [Entamoeba dispar SAW760]|eukprot:EDR22944.1 hypothetical protein EDI_351340 [Entamoeba dispar SAW760]
MNMKSLFYILIFIILCCEGKKINKYDKQTVNDLNKRKKAFKSFEINEKDLKNDKIYFKKLRTTMKRYRNLDDAKRTLERIINKRLINKIEQYQKSIPFISTPNPKSYKKMVQVKTKNILN